MRSLHPESSAPADEERSATAATRLSPRAVLSGAVLLTLLLALTPYNDYFIRGSYMANHHVPVAASFVLLLFCLLVNPVLRWLGRGFSARELTTVWAMLAVSSGLASAGLLRFLVPTLPAVRYFATPENRWADLLWPLLPPGVVPTDDRALAWFYDGSPPGYGVPWAAWLAPIAAWSAVAVLLWALLLALAVLLRRQWVDHERMTFVHTRYPLALLEEPEPGRRLNRFLGDPLMWIGFAVPVVLYGIIGLGNYFPAMPRLTMIYPNYYNRPVHFDQAPWKAVGNVYFAFFPSAVGFGFLLTTEVSLSTWVSYVLFRLEAVLFAAAGLQLRTMASNYGSKLFISYQDMGMYLALVGGALYVARRHLREAWGQAHGALGTPEAREYRWAIFGGLGALVALLVLASLAGMAWTVALGYLLGYLVVCTGLSWVTSNAGVLQLPVQFRPEDYLLSMVGTRNLRPRDLVNLAIPSRAFGFYYNELVMPHFLNNFKLAAVTDTPRRKLTGAMIFALLLGLAVAWVAQLVLVYGRGAYSLQPMSYLNWPRTPFEVVAGYLNQPQGPDPTSYVFMAVGAVLFTGLMALRMRCAWWPLHPVGLLMGSSMHEMWFSLFVAWLAKTVILRYGTHHTYERARQFFLGMVAGEATIACLWIVVGFVTKTGVRLLP